MEVILERKNEKFIFDTAFNFKYLSPIAAYVQWKLTHNYWDDYNELYHAGKLIEELKNKPHVWFHTHAILRNNSVLGVLLILGGKIKSLEHKYDIEKEDESLLLKFFHIADKGKGLGSFWLNAVIIPYYLKKNYKRLYVNSSHNASFPFYNRLGTCITGYTQMSDNNLYQREGSCFLINL